MKPIYVVLAALLLSLAIGCRGVGIAFSDQNSEPLVPEVGDGWLMFDLQPLRQSGAFQRYDCAFEAEGKTARFQFEVNSGGTSRCSATTLTPPAEISVIMQSRGKLPTPNWILAPRLHSRRSFLRRFAIMPFPSPLNGDPFGA